MQPYYQFDSFDQFHQYYAWFISFQGVPLQPPYQFGLFDQFDSTMLAFEVRDPRICPRNIVYLYYKCVAGSKAMYNVLDVQILRYGSEFSFDEITICLGRRNVAVAVLYLLAKIIPA